MNLFFERRSLVKTFSRSIIEEWLYLWKSLRAKRTYLLFLWDVLSAKRFPHILPVIYKKDVYVHFTKFVTFLVFYFFFLVAHTRADRDRHDVPGGSQNGSRSTMKVLALKTSFLRDARQRRAALV